MNRRIQFWGVMALVWAAGFASPALAAGDAGASCENRKYDNLLKLCSGLQIYTEDPGLSHCIKELTPIFRSFTMECQQQYLPKTIETMEPVIQRFSEKVLFDETKLLIHRPSLDLYFTAINYWADFLHGYDPKTVAPSMARVGQAYWRHINDMYVANNVLDRQRIFANSAVAIQSAFATTGETSLLAMYLIYQAFDQMDEQIATIAATEDYYCQVDDCEKSGDHQRFYVYRLAKSWKHFDQKLGLSTDPATENILAILHANQSKIFSQISRWFFDNIENQTLTDFPDIQRRFMGIFKTFSHLIRNKENDGYFTGSSFKQLRSGFDVGFKDRVLQRLKEQNQSLRHTLSDYDSLQRQHLALLLQRRQDQQSILDLDSNWQVLLKEYQNLAKDIRGLELSNLRKSKSFAEYNSAIEANKEIFAKYFRTEAIATDKNSWTVTAKDAKFTGSLPDGNIGPLAFQKVSATKGQIINVKISGQYSPRCALSKSPYFEGETVPAGLKYGPEGFVVKLTKGKASVESIATGSSKSTHDGYETNRPSCPSHRSSGCGGYVEGRRNTQYTNNTSTDSKHSDMSAHFSMGVKLPRTPFYDFPAGSVLAISMPPGKTSIHRVQDAKVLGAQNQLILDSDQDVYFVVNDCINSKPNTANALTIAVSKTMGLAQGQAMVSQFIEALKKTSKEGAAIVAAGANVSSEVNLLIKKVIAEFSMADAENSFYKVPKLRDLFDYWLHNESQKILNRAKVKELDRRIAVLAYKLNANRALRRSEDSREYLNQLRFQNLLANIDSNLIQKKLSSVLSFGGSVTLPMVRFHYPDVLERVSRNVASPAVTILSSFSAVGNYVKELTDQVEDTFSDEDAISKLKGQYRSMVLYFPRPSESFPGKVYYGSGLADVNRSYALWNAFLGPKVKNKDVTLSFYEHDFYRLDGAPGFLRCDVVNPVVMDAMIGFVFKKQHLSQEELGIMNDYGIVTGIEFSPLQSFATRTGLKDFRLKDASIGTTGISYGFVQENNIRQLATLMDRRTHSKNTGLGLSPISAIKLKDIEDVSKVFDSSCTRCTVENLTGIAIAFKVYLKHTNIDLNWPKACLAPGLNAVFKKSYLPLEPNE